MHSVSRRDVLHTAAAAATAAFSGCGGGSAASAAGGSSPSTPAPSSDFTATPISGPAPIVTNFVDASSGSISNWSWDFGDGATSTLQNPTHSYAAPGAYSVKLTVAGPGGVSTKARTQYVVVTQPSATKVLVSGPGSGPVGRSSGLFVVSTDAALQTSVVITPDDGGAGGTFAPT